MFYRHMRRLGEARVALYDFHDTDEFETGDYDRGKELELYEAVHDRAGDLLDHLRAVGVAKDTVRRRYPHAVAAPAEVRESCPPSVRTWRIVDLETGRVELLPGEEMPSEGEAWLSCRAALGSDALTAATSPE